MGQTSLRRTIFATIDSSGEGPEGPCVWGWGRSGSRRTRTFRRAMRFGVAVAAGMISDPRRPVLDAPAGVGHRDQVLADPSTRMNPALRCKGHLREKPPSIRAWCGARHLGRVFDAALVEQLKFVRSPSSRSGTGYPGFTGSSTHNPGSNPFFASYRYPAGFATSRVLPSCSSTGSCMWPWIQSAGW